MRNVLLALFLLAYPLSQIAVPLPAAASGYCAGQKNGKCPQPRKIGKNRSDFTPAQREKLMEQARNVCVRKYGATSRVFKLDYSKWTIVCTQPGY